MRYIFFTILILCSVYSQNNYELKLYEKIITSLYPNKFIKIYATSEIIAILKNTDKFILVDSCSANVELLIGKNFINLPFECRDKPIFSTNYRYYNKTDNSFGAFYWRKGRPQIRFKKDVLSKYEINLPANLQKYAK